MPALQLNALGHNRGQAGIDQHRRLASKLHLCARWLCLTTNSGRSTLLGSPSRHHCLTCSCLGDTMVTSWYSRSGAVSNKWGNASRTASSSASEACAGTEYHTCNANDSDCALPSVQRTHMQGRRGWQGEVGSGCPQHRHELHARL